MIAVGPPNRRVRPAPALLAAILLVGLLVGLGCQAPASPELVLPGGLPLSSLPASQQALLRVTLEISESTLPETDVVLDLDDLTVSGEFNLQNIGDGERTATLRAWGRFDADSEEVLLGRASDPISIEEGATTGLDFAASTFASCDIGVDSACSLEFDRNRNGVTNMLDLAPTSVAGGRGIDPAPQTEFLSVNPETLQFPSGIRLGQFARQVIVIENRGQSPIRVESLEVSGGQGVAMSLFDPFGGVATIARRSVPGDEITDEIRPGEELLIAVSFAPVNSFLTTAGIQVTARDVVTNVAQANRVKVIANVDGTLRPRPDSYVSPDIGPSLDVGSGSVPASPFPANELFSGQEITSTDGVSRGLPHVGSRLVSTQAGAPFSMPADRAFVVDIPADTRLAVSLSGLETDIDLAVVGLDAGNAVASVLVASRHPETGAESIDVLNDGDEPLRVAIVIGRVELDGVPALVGALALDTPAPFQMSAELSRGPEFSDTRGVEPASGAIEGNTSFTLRGRGFQPGAVVTFADFVALDVRVTVDPETEESVIEGLTPPGSSEIGKNPATIVVANPPADRGGDGQAATLPEAYLYDPPAARLDVVLPDVAPISGATEPITLLGNFFSDAQGPPRVNFGDTALDATFVATNSLTVQPGAAAAGTVIVTVQNQIRPGLYGAKSNGLAFRFAAPTGPIPVVSSLSAVRGSADGSDEVTVVGSGFVSGTRVLFGSVEATIAALDPSAITVRTPAVEADGVVAVAVINPDGQSATLRNAFTWFFPQPTIAGLLPQRVPTSGGTLVIVTGTSLRAGLTAVFTRDALTFTPLSVAVASTTSLLVTTPPLAVGTVTLVVTNPDGQSGVSAPIEVFEPQGNGPSIVFIDPASGPLQGQNVITVAGRDFSAAGVRVVINGVSVDVPVEKEAAAGLDRITVVAPPALNPGSVPIVVENPDGQSTAGAYLYVQVDLPRIDDVRPAALHFLPGTEVQILGDVFGGFSSSLQVFLGAGPARQTLPLVARSDGLVIARVTGRLPGPGPIGLTLTDGVITLNRTLAVVVPTIAFADERGDEIEVLGAHLAGARLQTFCAGADGYRPTVADDDALVVRRDPRLDTDCGAPSAPRRISLLYEGNQRFDPPGAVVTDETDADNDGVGVRDDADDTEPCVPSVLAGVCDFDDDGVINSLDPAVQDPCVPSSNATLCTRDSDGDGALDPVDAADLDPCVPNAQALTCTADADNDGVINPFDPADADPCSPNPASPACSADRDGDGVTDAFDPVDDNACVPNTTAANCDADNDGVLPPLDSANQDPCVPNVQHPLCGNDDDGDGLINALDDADSDPCVPNENALACAADADRDGVINPFDPNDADPCSPNPASPACAADNDDDGVTDAFDPVDDNPCVPDVDALVCDADRDGAFPPLDDDNQDACVPDDQHALCTDDDDRDGVTNALDDDDADPCVPDNDALTCANDDDGDGIVNPFDSDDLDPCAPNPAAGACQSDADDDGVTDAFDPVDDNPCVPDTDALTCDADGDGLLPPADLDNLDPCAPDDQHPLCTDDDDGDGFVNAVDPSDIDPCVPDANALSCANDDDGDGVINPFDSADADPCTPNPASSACDADSDGDGVTDVFDPADNNACVPNTTAVNCDADRDGAFPPADPDNTDPCTPDDQQALCTDDDDGDGTLNAGDDDDGDPCVPDSEALACGADDDGDGASNPFDPDDADACVPNPASPACTADSDGDGVTDTFDPVDNNSCVPDTQATNCDADGDGVLPPEDPNNTDPCVPNSQHPLCTDDDDNDGVVNAIDADDNDACVPNAQALTCTADADGDGIVNPFDPADADPCVPNPASPACSSDADGDGVSDVFDPVDDNACVPNTTATNCDADGDLVFPPADTNNTDSCVPDRQAATCAGDDDRDGVLNGADPNDTDPCVPDAQGLTCTADDDGDGVLNPFDPADANPCDPNPASGACTADADNDGVTDAFDPVDDNPCVPNTGAFNCDADGDLVFPPADTNNTNACVPNDQAATCTADDDGDGTLNAADPDDDDACIPDAQALACSADDDDDGVINPFDADDADPCAPNPASPACSADADDDGVTDPFDPVDNDPCVPNLAATNCDDDGDGVFPPADTRNTDPCVPDSNDALCEDDDDKDGVTNPNDADDSDGCVPNLQSISCDADGDGFFAAFDPNEEDGCIPDASSATCVICGDGLLRGGEGCDDDGLASGDGCAADCTVEVGFSCTGQPSTCLEICGDGIRGPSEACDDGNVDDGDGCSPLCVLECGDGVISPRREPRLESITFTYVATSCGGQAPINFRINGTLVASPTSPAGCTCTPGVQTAVVTDPALLAVVVDGANTFNVTFAPDGLAWATAIVDFGTTNGPELVVFDAGGGTDALNHNADLCGAGRNSNVNATVSGTVSGTEGCDDGGVADGDGCSSACAVEGGFGCFGEPSTCVVHPTSCLALRDLGQTTSGTYTIDPDGAGAIAPVDVFCDMVTDGGGYTFLKVAQSLQDFQAEAFCAARGMQMLVPRTQAHLRSSVAIARDGTIGPDASDQYMFMLGIYPDFQGARCTGQPMNSVTGNPATCQWGPDDGFAYFIHNTSFGEPNGDNCTTCSMNYSFNSSGDVSGFNDGNGHISSSRFICDVGDKH